MRNGKGTIITIVVIAAVVLLGLLLWWSANSNLTQLSQPTASSSTSTLQVTATDTAANIQSDLSKIDTGSTTQDLQQIDSDINSL